MSMILSFSFEPAAQVQRSHTTESGMVFRSGNASFSSFLSRLTISGFRKAPQSVKTKVFAVVPLPPNLRHISKDLERIDLGYKHSAHALFRKFRVG
jgi:hypothetical protein